MNEQLNKKRKIIDCLYSHFKNVPKKLKVVCDWDEVIQTHEPYALWRAINNLNEKEFSQFFKDFWGKATIEHSPYGSSLKTDNLFVKEQAGIKNSPNFYQQAPFLTIAKELLKLVKEDKVERLIFLSAYDKRKFPNGDPRKKEIFKETFGRLERIKCSLELIGFDNEKKGANKADWIKKNAFDFDIVIDDNPNICKSVVEANLNIIVCAPHYPAVENQHHEKVLLVKASVSDLKKENFRTGSY